MYKFAFLLILLSGNAYAGLFDSFKDPSTLILNQKDCRLGQASGEIVNGNFIVRGVAVIAILKKIDKSRISFENLNTSEVSRPIILNVEIVNKQISVSLPDGRRVISCNI